MSDSSHLDTLQAISQGFANIVATAGRSVVSVHAHRAQASGFVWRPGFVVTADEALADEGEIAISAADGGTLSATLAGRDATTDIALYRVDRTDIPVVQMTRDAVSAGSLAIVVGAQQGSPTATLGIVSLAGAGWRSSRGGEIGARIELDAAPRASAEGGVALDAGGRAFGMVVFGPRRKVLVIPAATIDRVAEKLSTHGRIARGYLGLGLHPVKTADGNVGAMVMSVDAKGPAAAAGMRQGDVIVGWDDHPLHGLRALVGALGPDSVGSVVRLSARCRGEPAEVAVTIGERPDA